MPTLCLLSTLPAGLHQKYNLFSCKDPELAAQVTLQCIRYPVVIVFSNVVVILQAIGMEVLINRAPVHQTSRHP